VPLFLREAARRSPLEVNMSLVEAHVPAGIEVRESDDVYPKQGHRDDMSQAGQVSLSDVIETFNATHADYRADVIDGVAVIRPVAARAPFLDQPSRLDRETTIMGSMAAMRRIFVSLDATLASAGIGSSSSPMDTQPMTIGGAGLKVIDALNQIAKQRPVAWNVITRATPGNETSAIIAFGLMHEHGQRDLQPVHLR
jgi:hypothetical protein